VMTIYLSIPAAAEKVQKTSGVAPGDSMAGLGGLPFRRP